MKFIVSIVFTLMFFNFLSVEASESFAQNESFDSLILPRTPDQQSQGSPTRVNYRVYFSQKYDPNKIHSVVYFLHGRNGNKWTLDQLDIFKSLDNWVLKNPHKNILIVAPECNNCYWMNAARMNARWADVITQELVSDVEKKFNTLRSPRGRLISGISMGGHGATQIMLNYPHIFGAMAAHSPVYRTQEEALKDFADQFGSGDDFQNRDPFSLIMIKNKKIEGSIWIDIGGSDYALNQTSRFADIVRQYGFNGELHIGEDSVGGHNGGYWSWHLPEYLQWYSDHLN